jgi:hypothetical protein
VTRVAGHIGVDLDERAQPGNDRPVRRHHDLRNQSLDRSADLVVGQPVIQQDRLPTEPPDRQQMRHERH